MRQNEKSVFLSLHFNGSSNSSIRGTEVWIYPDSPPPSEYDSAYDSSYQINYGQDRQFAQRMLDAAVGIIGSGTHGDGINTYDYNDDTHYAKTPANVYQDDVNHLKNLPISGIESKYLPISRACLIELAFISNPTDDTWFNGNQGEEHKNALANGLVDAIVTDIKNQP